MRIRYFIPLVMVATAVAVVAGLAIGCGETQPTGPTIAGAKPDSSQSHPGATPARNEWLAQRVAMALGNPGFRAYVWAQIQHSPIREHKLQFQRFLAVANWRAPKTIAQANGDSDDAVLAQAAQAQPLEFYMPVKAHLASWHADENVLVATAVADHDVPVAFDTKGRRYVLDAEHPPETPVLALVPMETNFDAPPARAQCTPSTCGDGGGSPLEPPPSGLYMNASHIPNVGQFEGWLKGDPEFEVHILGQMGTTDQLTDYQCAGEHAGGPYFYDQNTTDWNGSALLFSQDQLNAYKLQHPGQSVRIFMVEDDDQACVLRLDVNRTNALFAAVDTAYTFLTGGRDTVLTKLSKTFKYAHSGEDLIAAIASFINSNDDPVGNAVQDAIVGQVYPGYNWFIRGDHNITTGWIDLEMF
ncbi:MAG TPA: hypothetical protein VH113_01055 [Gemmatimonadales bacterium]|jgi:hypothetical protein|nr:hypothetical protein [Gemmatimonadales bacterium]